MSNNQELGDQLVKFTHEGIPDLPNDGQESTKQFVPGQLAQHQPAPLQHQPYIPAGPQAVPQPGTAMEFPNMGNPNVRPGDGYPMFELVAKRRPNGEYENVEYVTIITPGDKNAMPRRKVTDSIRQKYAQYYSLWRQGIQTSPVGTPLEAWPVLTPAQIMELKSYNIFTVEQLCDTPDNNVDQIPMGMVLRNQARDWIKQKSEADILAQRTAERDELKQSQKVLEETVTNQAGEIASLTAAIARLTTSFEAVQNSSNDISVSSKPSGRSGASKTKK